MKFVKYKVVRPSAMPDDTFGKYKSQDFVLSGWKIVFTYETKRGGDVRTSAPQIYNQLKGVYGLYDGGIQVIKISERRLLF